MLDLASLFVIFVILFVIYCYKLANDKPENFPPGPPRLPIWGSYWFMLKENYTFSHLALETIAKRYKTDVLGMYLGPYKTVVPISYDLCKEASVRDEFIGRVDIIAARARLRSEELKGIFFVDGPFWKEQRRFSLRHMRDYGFGRRSEVMEDFVAEEIRYMIDFLNNEPKPGSEDICKGKGHVLMPDFFFGPMTNSILLVLSSTRFDNDLKLRDVGRAVHRFLTSMESTGGAISMTPWLKYIAPGFFGLNRLKESNNLLFDFAKEMVDEHLKTFSDDHHRDFIDVFISETYREGYELDYEQITMLVVDYMLPSPFAIGNTMTFFLSYLINYPHIQTKIQEEIDRVVGRGRLPHLDDRKSLPYLEATFREIIRIFPLNPIGLTKRCVKDTMLGGYFVPKDTIILPCIYTAHRDEKIFKNPEDFQPERFIDEDGNLMKKDYTIGFGAGKRLCAGETFARHTLFLVASSLLQNFTFKSPTGKNVVLDVYPGVGVSSKGLWVKATPR